MHRFGRKGVGHSNDFVIVKQYSRVSSIKMIVNKAVFNWAGELKSFDNSHFTDEADELAFSFQQFKYHSWVEILFVKKFDLYSRAIGNFWHVYH